MTTTAMKTFSRAVLLITGLMLQTQVAEAADKTRVCLPLWKADQLKTAVLLAEKMGAFSKSGLEVELVNHQPETLRSSDNRGPSAKKIDDFAQADVARLALVEQEDAAKRPCDFAVALSDAFFQSGVVPEKFEPLLFSRYGYGYDTHLIVPRKSEIKSVKDLKGKKLALGPVMSRVALDVMLEKSGLSAKDVTVVSTNPFERVQQMRSGEIDAAIIYNPAMAILLSEGSVRVIEENIIAKYLKTPVPHTVLLANAQYAKKNPKLVAKLIDGIEQGNRALAADPTLLATMTEDYAKARGEKIHSYGASKVVLEKSAQIMGDFKLYRVTSAMRDGAGDVRVVDALNTFQDALVRYGYLAKKVDLSKWMAGKKLDTKSAGVDFR